MTERIENGAKQDADLPKRALQASLIFVGVVALASLVWLTAHYLLLFFAGILLAVFLDAIATGIRKVLPVPRPIRLVLAIALVAAAFAAIGLVIPSIVEQAPVFAGYLQQWAEWIRSSVAEWGPIQQRLEGGLPDELLQFLPSPAGVIGGAAQLLGSAFGVVTGLVIVVVFGVYFAVQPSRYYNATLNLFSNPLRRQIQTTAMEINRVLRRWLVGQIAMMLIIGVSSYVVLSLLDVSLALMLSFIAGLTAFIPYIGPLIGGGTMILVAATQDPTLGLIVIGFYAALQLVESYLLTPLIQSRAIFVPPAIVILAQIIFGVLFGILGIALATPLAAIIAVIVSRVYFHNHKPVKKA